jgi:hypothetical protein
MKTSTEIGELVGELVEARMTGDRERLIALILPLVRGTQADCLNVLLVLAGLLADQMTEEFRGIDVYHVHPDGTETPTDTRSLPAYVAIFAQMIGAVANSDRDFARDLFLGYVGGDGRKALKLLTFALTEVAHNAVECECAPEEATE